MSKTLSIKVGGKVDRYDIRIETGSLAAIGEWASVVTDGRPRKAALISNAKVFGLYGAAVESSLAAKGFDVSVCLIGDGERFKNLKSLEHVLGFLSEKGFSRSDGIVALGGGVVGDLAGFAASVYLRGIRFLQVPTTLLSMIDSSVGGKTAVNTPNGKNLVGTFYQPAGVLIDPSVLKTLSRREMTAGLCEAVKQAALEGGKLFTVTRNLVSGFDVGKFANYFDDRSFVGRFDELISAQVSFKAKIVRGDEREDPARIDPKSRKILNFGHTLAHALEKVTAYRYLKHGEAVGYGIMFAAEVSKKLELLAKDEVELLNDVVHRAGPLPSIAHLDPLKVFAAFSYDKKIVDRSLNWILLRGIGKPVIVPQKDIPKSVLTGSLKALLKH
ncbi:MAG: 3-dehydroquinate synthase [Acidobacteriota bacterium]